MEKFYKPTFKQIKTESRGQNHEVFELSPLERGFGHTLGNSLRRVILSNVSGVSGFAVEIKGVVHEFTTIPGVVEDVPEIILNLKNINIKADKDVFPNDETVLELKLKSKKGDVKAKDFVLPNGISIVNENQFIASTHKDGVLGITFYIKFGRGYKTFEQNKENIQELLQDKKGIIAIDSNFSPVKNVIYHVETYRPGTINELEKLTIDIETSGTKTPHEVIAIASHYLVGHFNEFLTLSKDKTLREQEIFTQLQKKKTVDQKLQKSIVELDLSVRSYNALKRMGIETIQDLVSKSLKDIENTKNLGKKSLTEVIEKVAELGLKFLEDEEE